MIGANTLNDLLEATGSDASTPGGGAIAAVAGALGAALGEMSCRYTRGRKYADRAAEIERLLASPYKGRRVDLEDPMQFYALTLSGSQGRAIIRSWFQSTVAEVEDSLRQHFLDLALVELGSSDLGPDLWVVDLLGDF